jgi:hypothetical protein
MPAKHSIALAIGGFPAHAPDLRCVHRPFGFILSRACYAASEKRLSAQCFDLYAMGDFVTIRRSAGA